MKILSIDPSIENIGVAILDGNKLIESYTLHTNPLKPLSDRIKKITQHFRELALSTEFNTVLIEYPDSFVRGGEYSKFTGTSYLKNVKSIQLLMLSIGVIASAMIEYCEINFVSVKDWKGSTDKKITQFVAQQECGKELNTHEADAFIMAIQWNRSVKFKHMIREQTKNEKKSKSRASQKSKRTRKSQV